MVAHGSFVSNEASNLWIGGRSRLAGRSKEGEFQCEEQEDMGAGCAAISIERRRHCAMCNE